MLVVLDACVLYPPSLRDLLLTLAALDAFDVAWSDEILEELRRNVIADHPEIDPDRFATHTLGAMRSAFPEANVTGYEHLTATMDNDPKDRHVAAAALSCDASAVVTLNLDDFRSRILDDAGIRVISPGELVDGLLQDGPSVVITAVEHLSGRWTRPTRSVVEILDLLQRHPTMEQPVSRLRRLIPGSTTIPPRRE